VSTLHSVTRMVCLIVTITHIRKYSRAVSVTPAAVLFYHGQDEDALDNGGDSVTIYKTIFSVDGRAGGGGRRGRCFVRHCGPSLEEKATWMCSCEEPHCRHVALAKEKLDAGDLLPKNCDPAVVLKFAELRKRFQPPPCLGDSVQEDYWEKVERSVSWRKVAPPKWIELEIDRQQRKDGRAKSEKRRSAMTAEERQIDEFNNVDDIAEPVLWTPDNKFIRLKAGEWSRCRYGHQLPPSDEQPEEKECVVYDLTQAYK